MKIKSENLRSIVINIVSSIIFQIILIIVSGSGIIYTVKDIINSLNDNTVTISILNLIILIFSCIIVTAAIILLCKSLTKNTKHKKRYNFDQIDDYYFSNYEKHITIYQNGNGIIIHKFTVIANDINKLQKIRRRLNIEDGVKTSIFPPLATMMQTNKAKRFDEFGFWYKSDNNIISDVKEYYWDDKKPNENKKWKNNKQELRWVFQIDKDRLKRKKPYEICYVVSVPGLAALQNGRLNKELLNDPSDTNDSSGMCIDHRIQRLKYTISFEDGVCIDVPPKCKCIISEQDSSKELDIPGIEDYDLLYRKYIFNIENPIFGSDINISWKYNII